MKAILALRVIESSILLRCLKIEEVVIVINLFRLFGLIINQTLFYRLRQCEGRLRALSYL